VVDMEVAVEAPWMVPSIEWNNLRLLKRFSRKRPHELRRVSRGRCGEPVGVHISYCELLDISTPVECCFKRETFM